MKKQLILLLFILINQTLQAQINSEYFKLSNLKVLMLEDNKYSEVTASARLTDGNIIIGGFIYSNPEDRKSTLLLIDKDGKILENAYESKVLSYNLYEQNDNFISDILPSKEGGVYVLGSSALNAYYTGYLSKHTASAEIIENFTLPNTTDTGFVRIHNYKMVEPNTTNKFLNLRDTLYCEPQKLLMQKDGKLIVVGFSRKQETEENYEDGEAFAIRLLPNGAVDSTFGIDGVSHINLTDLCEDAETAILDDKDNILILGKYNQIYASSLTTNSDNIFIAKLNKNGKIDSSFGENGTLVFNEENCKYNPVAILQNKDKSFYVFNNRELINDDDLFSYGLSVLKLNANGKLDNSFYNQGQEVITNMGIGFTNCVQRNENGKILLCGTNQNKVKSHLEGNEEILFSQNDENKNDKIYNEDELEEEGNIGFTSQLNEDGSIDTTFPKNGIYFTSWGDKTRAMFLSQILPISKNEYLTFGAGEDTNKEIGFLIQKNITDLKLGEIACKKDNGISFYPNPVANEINIEFDLCKQENLSIKLYDVTGKIVFTFLETQLFEIGHHNRKLNIENQLPSGYYILSIQGPSTLKSVKIVKQ